ncbi:MAG: hypothetical protein QOC54_450, partial [Baekduia sp.]|nr:hypothetical protein [Baekduia sp.]
HLDPRLWARIAVGVLVGRLRHRHEQDRVEPELGLRLLRDEQVGDVRWVERPAQDADPAAGARLRAGVGAAVRRGRARLPARRT